MSQNLHLSRFVNFAVRFIQIIIVFPMAVLFSFYIPPYNSMDYELHFLLCLMLSAVISIVATKLSRKLVVLMFLAIIGTFI